MQRAAELQGKCSSLILPFGAPDGHRNKRMIERFQDECTYNVPGTFTSLDNWSKSIIWYPLRFWIHWVFLSTLAQLPTRQRLLTSHKRCHLWALLTTSWTWIDSNHWRREPGTKNMKPHQPCSTFCRSVTIVAIIFTNTRMWEVNNSEVTTDRSTEAKQCIEITLAVSFPTE